MASATATGTGNIFDPPSGHKVLNAVGLPELEWRMVWINDSNNVAINVQITDNIPAGTTYVANSFTCDARGSSTTTTCTFDSVNNRVFWQGNMGPDLGATDENNANNEVVLMFRISVPSSTNQVTNQASSLTDTDGDGSFTDETTAASVSASNQVVWTRAATATPAPAATVTSAPGSAALIVDPNVSKAVSASQASVGQTLVFTLTVTNAGNTAANNVVVSDPISSFLTITQLIATKGTTSINGQTATFNIGVVNPAEVVTLTIVTQVNSTATLTVDLTNTASFSHLANGATTSESSNVVNFRLVGEATLPNTGEPPEEGGSSAIRIVNWILILAGLGLCVLGGYRLLRRRREVKSLALGIVLLFLSLSVSLMTSPDNAPHNASSSTQAPASQVAAVSPTQLPSDVVVIVAPTVTPEEENLPIYPTPAPPAVTLGAPLIAPTVAAAPTESASPERAPTTVSATISPTTATTIGSANSGPDTSSVTRILIPSKNVDAAVKYIPFDGLTWELKGLKLDVAWLGNTSWPGLGGNTVLAGHVTLRGGIKGPFHYLEQLSMGTQVLVYTERNLYTYVVREQVVVEPTDMYVTYATDKPQLTLLTCSVWDSAKRTYTKRQVAFADLIAVASLTAGN
jgi:LPXTG-site transpeptidase (sortase) family protein